MDEIAEDDIVEEARLHGNLKSTRDPPGNDQISDLQKAYFRDDFPFFPKGLRFGVLGTLWGSKYLLSRCLDVGLVSWKVIEKENHLKPPFLGSRFVHFPGCTVGLWKISRWGQVYCYFARVSYRHIAVV